jgi:hypothetical protein
LSNKIEAVKADQQNFLDNTDDEVKAVAATTDVNEAVEAITAHINKYDVPEEKEEANQLSPNRQTGAAWTDKPVKADGMTEAEEFTNTAISAEKE